MNSMNPVNSLKTTIKNTFIIFAAACALCALAVSAEGLWAMGTTPYGGEADAMAPPPAVLSTTQGTAESSTSTTQTTDTTAAETAQP